MSVERIITKIPTEAEIEQASPNEIGKISWAVVCDLLGGTITTKDANAISTRVSKRLQAIERELSAGSLA